jgi:hypothetical protein
MKKGNKNTVEIIKAEPKTLYFAGMGCDFWKDDPIRNNSDIGNYRIRTTFKDQNNNIIFVEFSNGASYIYKGSKPHLVDYMQLVVNHLYNRTLSDNENESHIKSNAEGFRYTKADIIKFIELNFNVRFDDIVILNRCLSGFDYKKTTGDEFIPNIEKMQKAFEIKEYFDNFERQVLGKKYPTNSVYWDETTTKLNVLIHYNCYNDKFIIDPFQFNFDYQPPSQQTLK